MKEQKEIQKISPLTAIRNKCLDCCCDQAYEVKLCPATKCPLHPFRFGKNPFRKRRELTDQQRKEIGERLKASLGRKMMENV